MARAKQTVNKSPSLTLAVLALCYLTSSWCYSVSQALPADIDALQGKDRIFPPFVSTAAWRREKCAVDPASPLDAKQIKRLPSPMLISWAGSLVY